MILMLVMSCFGPVSMAMAQEVTPQPGSVHDKVSKPWLDQKTSWNGKWGALNETESESVAGECSLTKSQSQQLADLLAALKHDWDAVKGLDKEDTKKFITKFLNKSSSKTVDDDTTSRLIRELYKNIYTKRITIGVNGLDKVEGLDLHKVERIDEAVLKAMPKYGSDITTLTYDRVYYDLSKDPDLAGCDAQGSFASNLATLPRAPKLSAIWQNPAVFFIELITYPAFMVTLFVYNIVAPFALGFTLSTPHTERGDTMWDSYEIFAKTEQADSKDSGLVNNENCQGTSKDPRCKKVLADTDCNPKSGEGSNHLGFDCNNVAKLNAHGDPLAKDGGKESNKWLSMAKGLRNLLSAAYGAIVIGVALIYIYRKSPGAAYDVKTILPRVFLAVVFSTAAPFLMGSAITMSNWTVKGIMSAGHDNIPARISASIQSVSEVSGVADGIDGVGGLGRAIANFWLEIKATALPTLLLGVFTAVFLTLIVVAVVRQIALILLIIFTPLACLALVYPKYQHAFAYWVRGITAITVLPVIQALILTIGLALADTFWDPATPGDAQVLQLGRFVSALTLAISAKMMLSAVKAARIYATGVNGSLARMYTGQAIGTLGGLAAARLNMKGFSEQGQKVNTYSRVASGIIGGGGGGGGSSWLGGPTSGNNPFAKAPTRSMKGLPTDGLQKFNDAQRQIAMLDRLGQKASGQGSRPGLPAGAASSSEEQVQAQQSGQETEEALRQHEQENNIAAASGIQNPLTQSGKGGIKGALSDLKAGKSLSEAEVDKMDKDAKDAMTVPEALGASMSGINPLSGLGDKIDKLPAPARLLAKAYTQPLNVSNRASRLTLGAYRKTMVDAPVALAKGAASAVPVARGAMVASKVAKAAKAGGAVGAASAASGIGDGGAGNSIIGAASGGIARARGVYQRGSEALGDAERYLVERDSFTEVRSARQERAAAATVNDIMNNPDFRAGGRFDPTHGPDSQVVRDALQQYALDNKEQLEWDNLAESGEHGSQGKLFGTG